MKKSSVLLGMCALSLSTQPLLAQDRHIEAVSDGYRQPEGITASIGLRVPLGGSTPDKARPTYAATVAYGQHFEANNPLQPDRVRAVQLAQLNFDDQGARNLKLARFDLTTFGRENIAQQRANLSGGETALVVVGVVVVAVAAIFLLADDPLEGAFVE